MATVPAVSVLLVTCVILVNSLAVYQQQPIQYASAQSAYGYQQPIVVAAHKPLRQAEKEQQQDLSKVPGVAGVDYPLYHSVPQTRFSCHDVPAVPGMYANVETGCQAYHVCHDGREGNQGASFLCTNGTLFNQKEFTCDWWYNVDCHNAQSYYRLNADPLKNPYFPKPKPEDELKQHAVPAENYY